MNDHDLAAQLSGLASRVNNLAAHHSGEDSWTLNETPGSSLDGCHGGDPKKSWTHEVPNTKPGGCSLKNAIDFIGTAD